MKNMILAVLMLCCFSFSGCASLWDAPKNIIGVSVKDMEDRRNTSIYQAYKCGLDVCFDAVLSVAQKNKYTVFMKDREKGVVVLMDIPGAVNTTEVGIFLTADGSLSEVKVEVSSRSSPAKRAVARAVLGDLSLRFQKI